MYADFDVHKQFPLERIQSNLRTYKMIEIESRKTEKIEEPKSRFFENISKID